MIYFKEHSIKEIREKEQAAQGGGTSAEDKQRITDLEKEMTELSGAIERGLTELAQSTAASRPQSAAHA